MKDYKNDYVRLAKNTMAATALLGIQGITQLVHAQNSPKAMTASALDYDLKAAKKYASKELMTLVAMQEGQPVFKSSKGEVFRLDTETGDITQVSQAELSKLSCCIKTNGELKKASVIQKGREDHISTTHSNKRLENPAAGITILGVDKDGHTIMKNQKGEAFYLDPKTGDMIDYESHAALLK